MCTSSDVPEANFTVNEAKAFDNIVQTVLESGQHITEELNREIDKTSDRSNRRRQRMFNSIVKAVYELLLGLPISQYHKLSKLQEERIKGIVGNCQAAFSVY